jgi:hypothetical protein
MCVEAYSQRRDVHWAMRTYAHCMVRCGGPAVPCKASAKNCTKGRRQVHKNYIDLAHGHIDTHVMHCSVTDITEMHEGGRSMQGT